MTGRTPLQTAAMAVGGVFLLVGGGAIYAVLWIYGLIIDFDSGANFVALNTPDNWLHFVLAVGMIGLGLALGGGARAERRGPAETRP